MSLARLDLEKSEAFAAAFKDLVALLLQVIRTPTRRTHCSSC